MNINGRAFVISGHELRLETSKSFLYDCYLRFKSLVRYRTTDDLVLVWKDDYDELFNYYMEKHLGELGLSDEKS